MIMYNYQLTEKELEQIRKDIVQNAVDENRWNSI